MQWKQIGFFFTVEEVSPSILISPSTLISPSILISPSLKKWWRKFFGLLKYLRINYMLGNKTTNGLHYQYYLLPSFDGPIAWINQAETPLEVNQECNENCAWKIFQLPFLAQVKVTIMLANYYFQNFDFEKLNHLLNIIHSSYYRSLLFNKLTFN